MTDKELDSVLKGLSEEKVTAQITLVVSARQKALKHIEKKELMKEYAPIVLSVVISTILTVLTGCIGLFFVKDMKAILSFVAAILGLTQIPLLIFLLTTIYYKENNNQKQ